MERPETLLVIDEVDEDAQQLERLLDDGRRVVLRARSLREARGLLQAQSIDLVFLSLELAELPGPRVVRAVGEAFPGVPVVAVTVSPDPSAAVATVRAGGVDYLGKPVSPARLEQAVSRGLRNVRAERLVRETRQMVRDRFGFQDMLSRSPKMLQVFDQLRAVAPTDATVLVLGETGTGKELVARALHEGSRRKEKACISVNCGAFAEGLLESELFGHERGSFTGATERRVGVFELADGGTLFLDELADTSLATQVNLLRVIEEMSFRRVGGEKLVDVDVRVVAATHEDLPVRVADGRFRADLYYRLNVFPIRLPPLRERREDIPLLLHHFLNATARDYGLKAPRIAADAMAWILGYTWPGNVRQLRALCERWVIVASGGTLLREMLPADLLRPGPDLQSEGSARLDVAAPLVPQVEAAVAQLERAYFHELLGQLNGRVVEAADHAGIARRTLYNKLKLLGLDPDRYRGH